MQTVIRWAGAASSRRVAPTYWNLYADWAMMAMRIAIADKQEERRLSVFFEASEIMCLAELLQQQQQNLRSISIYGKAKSTSES